MALRIHELFYDPLSIAYDEGNWIAPIGGHSDHVHVSFANPTDALLIIGYAQAHGLRVGENPYVGDNPGSGVHVDGSYHYRSFPQTINGRKLGMAVDVTGSSSQMAQFASWVKATFTGGGNSASSLQATTATYAPDGSSSADTYMTGAGKQFVAGQSCLVMLAFTAAAVGMPIAAVLLRF